MVEDQFKESLAMQYNQAALITSFISRSLNGKQLPSIEETFPQFFKKEYNAQILLEQFKSMANNINNKHKGGQNGSK